jgi:esterase/lipase
MQPTGILLIHGLMGSPREYDALESILQAEGYQTQTVTLPGHGLNPTKSFHAVTADEILEHCLTEYHLFAEHCQEVIIVGHSLGGICTLLTAAEQPPKLAGIITFSAPYEHAYLINRMFDFLSVPLNVLIPGMLYLRECQTGFERPQYTPLLYPRLLEQTKVMFRYLQERLPEIQVPVCLGHSRYDLSSPYLEMEKIATALKNADHVIQHTFEECGHQIFPHSREQEKATKVVLTFLNNVCQSYSIQGR